MWFLFVAYSVWAIVYSFRRLLFFFEQERRDFGFHCLMSAVFAAVFGIALAPVLLFESLIKTYVVPFLSRFRFGNKEALQRILISTPRYKRVKSRYDY